MQLGKVYYCMDSIHPGAEPIPGVRLVGRVGIGDGSEVWSAEASGGFDTALKFIRLPCELTAEERAALDCLRNIRHPNLLPCFGVWRAGEFLLIGMELADRSLWDRFGEAIDAGSPGIPRGELLTVMAEAAKGIDYLNQPRQDDRGEQSDAILHLGIKPQNLLLVGGGAKLADFGLARLADSLAPSRSDRRWTFAYTAPETFQKAPGPHSDQYSLAAVYCHLRGGRPPFTGSREALRNGHLARTPDLSMLPEAERAVVARALAKAPGDRWPSCCAMVEALLASDSTSRLIQAAPSVPGTRLGSPAAIHGIDPRSAPRRRREFQAIAAAALVLLASGTTLTADRLLRSRATPTAPGADEADKPAMLRRVSFKPIPPLEWPDDLPLCTPSPVPGELPSTRIEETGVNHPTPAKSVQDQAATRPVRLDHNLLGKPAPPADEPPPLDDPHNGWLAIPDPGKAATSDPAACADTSSEPPPAPQPPTASAPLLRGNKHLEQKEYEQAIAAYAEASRLDPEDPRPWINQGSAYYHIDDHVQAAAALTEAIRLNPLDAIAWNNRGLAYRSLGEFRKAIDDYSEAVRLRPDDPVVRYNRGLAYSFLGDQVLAVADFDEAIRLRPDYSSARQARQSTLARKTPESNRPGDF